MISLYLLNFFPQHSNLALFCLLFFIFLFFLGISFFFWLVFQINFGDVNGKQVNLNDQIFFGLLFLLSLNFFFFFFFVKNKIKKKKEKGKRKTHLVLIKRFFGYMYLLINFSFFSLFFLLKFTMQLFFFIMKVENGTKRKSFVDR